MSREMTKKLYFTLAHLIRFMEYCDFTEGFLLLASDYEVRKRILDKFEVYKKEKLHPNDNSK